MSDQITVSRELLRQVLDAHDEHMWVTVASEALRAALEQPAVAFKGGTEP